MRRVDERHGVYRIKNATVKHLEQMERLRLERLRRVYKLLNARGLSCYPERPLWPDEWFHFVVYRRDLLAVDLTKIARDAELSASLDRVLSSIRYSYSHTKAPTTGQLHDALRKLSSAKVVRNSPAHRHLTVA
ncbi:hypothetical protein ACF1BS_07540 [Streptomyces sp. NPDC014748]|uniref:hypothetical protein n=1 Tax=Streptomyces sp. NPDC014748 TaxID=3364905 RepID=UPI0036FE70D2